MDTTTIAVVAGCLLLSYLLWQKGRRYPLSLPPSPKSYPLLGHLLSIPTKNEHLGFTELGKQLNSDIFSLSVFGDVVIVLNNREDVINLLEKRSGIYSNRPRFPAATDPSLMDWGDAVTVMNYGHRWKQSRRLIHRWLNKQAAEAFQPAQLRQARLLLQTLLEKSRRLESSEELEVELCEAISSTLMDSLYGQGIRTPGNDFAMKAKRVTELGGYAAMPSSFMVNVFPALINVPDWVPGTSWKRILREWAQLAREAGDNPFSWTKAEMKKSIHEPSIVESMLGQSKELGMSSDEADKYVKAISLVLFGAGLDTSTNAALVFFLAMILYPDVQKKAQEEIDLVIGSERLPNMEDRAQLPYVNRLIQELYRWWPVGPLAIPHATQEEDIYKGYRIPKGATVAIGHDPKVYPDPDNFNPDRFLDPTVPLLPIFGFGRRICPGSFYAESTLFAIIADVLAAFKVEVARDAHGNNLVPKTEGQSGIVYHPLPFKLKLTPRSVIHEQLVLGGASM